MQLLILRRHIKVRLDPDLPLPAIFEPSIGSKVGRAAPCFGGATFVPCLREANVPPCSMNGSTMRRWRWSSPCSCRCSLTQAPTMLLPSLRRMSQCGQRCTIPSAHL